MFLKNSRYAGLPTMVVPGTDGDRRLVALRRLPATTGDAHPVQSHDQLDAISEQRFGADATRYWHIADANTEIDAAELTAEPGREIVLPRD